MPQEAECGATDWPSSVKTGSVTTGFVTGCRKGKPRPVREENFKKPRD
jgi:hypothetical protein